MCYQTCGCADLLIKIHFPISCCLSQKPQFNMRASKNIAPVRLVMARQCHGDQAPNNLIWHFLARSLLNQLSVPIFMLRTLWEHGRQYSASLSPRLAVIDTFLSIFINNLIFNIERLKSNPVLFKFRLTPYHDPVVLSDGLKPKDLLFIPLNSVYSILCPDIIH